MALGSATLAMPQYCFCETPRMDEPFFIGPSELSLELRHPAAERRLSFQNFFGPPFIIFKPFGEYVKGLFV